MVPRRAPEPCLEPLALPLPAARFPYGDLLAENGRRGKLDPEYELLDTASSTTTATGSSRSTTRRRTRTTC